MPRFIRLSLLLAVPLLCAASLAHEAAADPSSTLPAARRVGGRSASALSARPLTAEEQVLAGIQLEGQRRVEALMRPLAGSARALDTVQRAVEQVKRKTELEMLRTKSTFARDRGDFAAVRDLDLRIDLLAHPRPNAHAGETAATKPTTTKAGRP